MNSPPSNEELCASALRGDAGARNELVENNLGFIRKTANELWSSQRELNSALLLDREDLVQEGALGLLRCVDTFDPESGGKFLSYAAPAVRNAMLDSIRERSRTLEAQNIGSRTSLESAALYGTGKTPEQLYLERESFEELHAALGRIEPREWGVYRVPLRLRRRGHGAHADADGPALPPVGEPSEGDGAPGLGRRAAGAAVVVLRRVAAAGM